MLGENETYAEYLTKKLDRIYSIIDTDCRIETYNRYYPELIWCLNELKRYNLL